MNHQVAEDITDKVHKAMQRKTADEELIRADDERKKRRILEDRAAFDRAHPGLREQRAQEAQEQVERDETIEQINKEYKERAVREKMLSEAKARQLQREEDVEDERRRADPVWIAKDNALKLEKRLLYKKNHCRYPWGKLRETIWPTNEDNYYRNHPKQSRGGPLDQFSEWMHDDGDMDGYYNAGFGVKK